MRHLERHSAILALCILAAPCVSARAMQNVASDSVARIAMPVTSPEPMVTAAAELATPAGALTPAGVTRRMNAADQDAQRNVLAARIAEGSRSKNSAMMVVGGAAFLVGAVVGGRAGTVVM